MRPEEQSFWAADLLLRDTPSKKSDWDMGPSERMWQDWWDCLLTHSLVINRATCVIAVVRRLLLQQDFSCTREGYIGESLCGKLVQPWVSPLRSCLWPPARSDQSAWGCSCERIGYNPAWALHSYTLYISGCTQSHMNFFITASQGEKLEAF